MFCCNMFMLFLEPIIFTCADLGCISLLLTRLPGAFELHWLGNIGSLGSNKEIQRRQALGFSHSPLVSLVTMYLHVFPEQFHEDYILHVRMNYGIQFHCFHFLLTCVLRHFEFCVV